MRPEDYKRAVRAMGDITPNDKAAITVILKENGDTFISATGDMDSQVVLLDRIASYYESVGENMKGGSK